MRELKIHGVYKHYKGDSYIVEDVATHTETGELMVIYRGLYGENKLWARPLEMFLEELDDEKRLESGQRCRFEPQEIESKRK